MRREDAIPIVGIRGERQLVDNLKALDSKLTEEELRSVDAVVPSPYRDHSEDGSFTLTKISLQPF
ncbi:hypothetical protein [Saccharibacillus alkalitolerans]|uniref:hypothetical protein n=1 Tax=Saccharibacillus alkalitolerans TaxID=2705290 RepID=UPI00197ECBAA|nr:hypothetical protein [Saccharibacillus alkalitolerans]